MNEIMTMIESASVMLLSVLAIAHIRARFAERPQVRSLLLGLLFSFVGVIVMNNSVEVVPGIRTDPRAAVVVLSAAFGGPPAVMITAPILAFMRMVYGGAGAVPGATYILGTGCVAALVWVWWFQIARRPLSFPFILAQSAVASIAPPLILLWASGAPWSVYLMSNGLASPTNFLAVMLFGTMVLRDQERQTALVERSETQAQIDAIADNAPSILFQMIVDASGRPRFTYVSKASERILGVSSRTMVDRIDTLGTIAGTSAVDDILAKLRESDATGEPWTLEIECVRPDGGTIWLRVDTGRRIDRSGRPVWDGTMSDITEQKRAERMKDEFISTVSHELRTPLTSIRGSLGLVVAAAPDQLPAKVARMLDIASRNAERLVLLINDILDMQKLRSGEMQFDLSEESIRPRIDHAMISAQSYLPEKSIKFVVTDDAPGSFANVDPHRLDQVLANLLSNAIKFAPDGSTVTISLHRADDILRISVRDRGPGIPEAFRARIFERFSQAETSSTRKAGGTGLGLNISKAIVEAMSGDIWFETEPGTGTTFHVDLPATGGAGVTAATATRASPLFERILVCGTDPQLGPAVRSSLESGRFSIDVAPDIGLALELIAARRYAALVIDMNAVPSPDLFRQIRSDAQTSDLPVIVVSGDISETSKLVSGSATDVIDWLDKPLDRDRLRAALDEAFASIPRAAPHVLYVEDDPSLHEILRQNIGDDVRLSSATSVATAREMMSEEGPDLVLLDLELPDGNGIELLADLPDHMPVIIFSAHDVAPDIRDRVGFVMTKSRVREVDVAQAVLGALPRSRTEPDPRPAVA